MIFAIFDDWMTQIDNTDLDDDVNRQNAKEEVEKSSENNVWVYLPPRADACFEGKCCLTLCHSADQMAQCPTLCRYVHSQNRNNIYTRPKHSRGSRWSLDALVQMELDANDKICKILLRLYSFLLVPTWSSSSLVAWHRTADIKHRAKEQELEWAQRALFLLNVWRRGEDETNEWFRAFN